MSECIHMKTIKFFSFFSFFYFWKCVANILIDAIYLNSWQHTVCIDQPVCKIYLRVLNRITVKAIEFPVSISILKTQRRIFFFFLSLVSFFYTFTQSLWTLCVCLCVMAHWIYKMSAFSLSVYVLRWWLSTKFTYRFWPQWIENRIIFNKYNGSLH